MFNSMMVNNLRDIFAFFAVFLCGVCVGVVFDIFRAHRKIYPPSSRLLSLEDAIFCAIAFFLFSHTVTKFADGDLRWYIFAGFFLGLMLYFLTLSKMLVCILTKAFELLKHILSMVSRFLSYLAKPFLRFFKKTKRAFLNLKGKANNFFKGKNIKKRSNLDFCKKIFKKIFTTQKK